MLVKHQKNLTAILRKKKHEDTLLGAFVFFIYRFFLCPYISAAIAVIFSLLESILSSGKHYTGLIIVAVLHLLLLGLSVWAQHYSRKKEKDVRAFKGTLDSFSSIFAANADSLSKTLSLLKGAGPRTEAQTRQILSTADFQTVSLYVCRKLKETLSYDLLGDEISVTIFQRDSTYCHMIAYSEDTQPVNFEQKYKIPSRTMLRQAIFPHHIVLFARNEKTPSILPNADAVKKANLHHEGSEKRATLIQQYIGIPIAAENLGTVLLLQIDTTIAGHFGDSTESIREMYYNTIRPYALFLYMMYEKERTIDLIIK